MFVDEDIIAAIESLPENFRLPVLYADVEGFSYKEIAEILDVPIGTVMSRLHRGRKALQRKLWNLAVEHGLVEPARMTWLRSTPSSTSTSTSTEELTVVTRRTRISMHLKRMCGHCCDALRIREVP